MTLRLKESEPLDGALRRLAMEGVDQALEALDEREGREAAIHAIRKRCKELRSLLCLFRDSLGDESARELRFFRDLARSLSAARDASVALDVHAALVQAFRASIKPSVGAEVRQLLIADLREILVRPATGARKLPDRDSLRAQLLGARARSRRWKPAGCDEGILERGLLRSYRRARKASLQANRSGAAEDLHELRKRAKSFWYQLDMVARRWPDCALKRSARLRRLAQALGEIQDLVLYREAIERAAAASCPEGVDLFKALADQRRGQLQTQALDLAQLVFAEKPKELRADLRRPDAPARASA